jgi:hypothetical protein
MLIFIPASCCSNLRLLESKSEPEREVPANERRPENRGDFCYPNGEDAKLFSTVRYVANAIRADNFPDSSIAGYSRAQFLAGD